MTREQKDELCRLLSDGAVRFDEKMSSHSSMKVGGPAEAFAIVNDIDELKKVTAWAVEQNIDYRFLGGGSNTLFCDGGIKGLVLKLGKGFDFTLIERTDGEDVYVKIGPSGGTPAILSWTVKEGLSGFEGLAGVWGTFGGNIITNAGTCGGAVADVIEELTVVTKEGRELTMKRPALNFEYRRLKLPRTAAIVSALVKLKKSTQLEISKRVEAIMKKRKETQPVGQASLGCIFKNPGKNAAGMLIEEAGLKGVRVGGARVSGVHANFIINEGKATARDVVVLINLIKERVKENTGIALELEIEIVGEN